MEGQALETVAQVRETLQGNAPEGAVNREHAARLRLLSGPGACGRNCPDGTWDLPIGTVDS